MQELLSIQWVEEGRARPQPQPGKRTSKHLVREALRGGSKSLNKVSRAEADCFVGTIEGESSHSAKDVN